jgi:hypothetical protein
VGEDDRADLHCSPAQEQLQVRAEKGLGEVAKDLQPVSTAASEAEAIDRFAEFSGKWEKCYRAIIRLWENAGRKRWTNRWKAALYAFDITFDGRLSAGRR